jgi:hypothetical protein
MYAVVKDQVAPCGIRCGECELGNGGVAGTARALKESLGRYGVSQWVNLLPGGDIVDYPKFEQNLAWVGTMITCPGCLNGGGSPACPIRICSKEKGLGSCGKCDNLEDCDKFDWLGEHGKALKSGLARNK